jgi:hypothetical protein
MKRFILLLFSILFVMVLRTPERVERGAGSDKAYFMEATRTGFAYLEVQDFDVGLTGFGLAHKAPYLKFYKKKNEDLTTKSSNSFKGYNRRPRDGILC